MNNIEQAHFETIEAQSTWIRVHFNPASLQYQVSNTLASAGRGRNAAQYVSQSSGKLTMDLVFDTTDTGEDVRTYTGDVAKLMKPVPGRGARNVPARVAFVWGSYRFEGIFESYKETFDFFAATGIPLRAGVNLTLSTTGETVFDETTGEAVGTQGGGLQPDAPAARAVPTGAPGPGPAAPNGASSPAGSPAAVAAAAGNPRAARALAAANGQESLRFSTAATLLVPGGASLRAAAGIAGLGAAAQGSAGLDPSRLAQASATASMGTGAEFAPGGRAQLAGAASLRADVGAGASLSTRVRFEG